MWQLGSRLNTGTFVFDNNRKFIQFNGILSFFGGHTVVFAQERIWDSVLQRFKIKL